MTHEEKALNNAAPRPDQRYANAKSPKQYLESAREDERLYSTAEAAHYLGCSNDQVHQWIRERLLRPCHGVKNIWLAQSTLDSFILWAEKQERDLESGALVLPSTTEPAEHPQ